MSYDTFIKTIKTIDYVKSNKLPSNVKKLDFSKVQIISISPVAGKTKRLLLNDLTANSVDFMKKHNRTLGGDYKKEITVSNSALKSILARKLYQEEITGRKKTVRNVNYSNLYVGDAKTRLEELEANLVDCVVIDPPYNIDFGQTEPTPTVMKKAFVDKMAWDDFAEVVVELRRVMKADSHLYCFCSYQNIDKFKNIIEDVFEFRNILIWVKNNFSPTNFEHNYAHQHEMIVFATKGKKRFNFVSNENRARPDVLNFSIIQGQFRYHTSQKPLDLLSHLIENSTVENETVLDCYAGSGSTAVAAARLGRNWIMIEKEKRWVDVIKERLENETKSNNNGTESTNNGIDDNGNKE